MSDKAGSFKVNEGGAVTGRTSPLADKAPSDQQKEENSSRLGKLVEYGVLAGTLRKPKLAGGGKIRGHGIERRGKTKGRMV